MYDFGRPAIIPCATYSNEYLCSFSQLQHKLKAHQRKYQQPTNIQLCENICSELYKYYSSLWYATNDLQEQYARLIMFSNLKEHVVAHANQHQLSLQHKMLYIIYNYFEGLVRKQKVDWKLIKTIFVLTNQEQQLLSVPQSFKLLLNFQYQELLAYLNFTYTGSQHKQKLQFLIELIDKKMLQNHSQQKNLKFSKIQNQNKTKFTNIIFSPNKSKGSKNQWSFSSRFHNEIELLCGIMTGNRDIIQSISKGCWTLYLSLYLTYVNRQQLQNVQFYQIVYDYLKKYHKNHKFKLNIVQQYCLFLVCKMPLVQTYQLGFHVMSSFINNLVVYQAFDMDVSKVKILINSPEFYETLQDNLLENAANISWKTMLNTICILNMRSQPLAKQLVQNLMKRYLPNDIQNSNQILGIQQKLKDLKQMGLSYFSQEYMCSIFQFYISRQKYLTQILLQIFVLNIENAENAQYKSSVFRRMKDFLIVYFQNYYFNFQLLDSLQNLIERKQTILGEHTIYKIQQMFSVMYKLKNINEEIGVNRVILLHKLLNDKSVKCLQTLKTIQTILKEREDDWYLKTKHEVKDVEGQAKFNRSLKIKVIDYLKQWEKIYIFESCEEMFEERMRSQKIVQQIRHILF